MDDQLDNIVPVLAIANKYSLQEAINGACELVREARRILEEAEKRVPLPTGNADLDGQIKRYIQACKDLVAGELNWWYGPCHVSRPRVSLIFHLAIATKGILGKPPSEKET